jgi:hypothetical protein
LAVLKSFLAQEVAMSNLSSPELWFISPPDAASGFLFIATQASDQLDVITKLMIDKHYNFAASLSDANSRFHVKDDCGIVYASCLSEDNLPFIGGSIIPYLSKRKLVGWLALPTFLIGIVLVTTMLLLILVMLSASLALFFGNVDLALIIGRNYSLLLLVLLILVGPFLLFAIPLIMIQRRHSNVIRNLKVEVKSILQVVFPDHRIHERETYHHVKSKQVPELLSALLNQFSKSIPDVTHEQMHMYDISNYDS